MATNQTKEGRETIEEGRQTVLETLHSKLLLILHITQFPIAELQTVMREYFIRQKPLWIAVWQELA